MRQIQEEGRLMKEVKELEAAYDMAIEKALEIKCECFKISRG